MAQVYLSQYSRRAAFADTASHVLNAPTAAIALPGGQNTQIQFNSGGLALSGSNNFTFNYASNPRVLSMTGSTILSGSTFLFGIPNSGLTKVLVYNNLTGQVAFTASSAFGGPGSTPGGPNFSIQYNNSSDFDGSDNFTFNGTNTVTLTGSMIVSGAISASSGPSTVGFFGTASWAVSASQAVSASFALTASFAISSSRATTASFALTASFATTASFASSSPNFANTDLVFTSNRKHSTDNYSYFIYSDLVGGNETDPFQGFGVSGSFYFFNSSSNVLGTAAGSTNTYTYIEITSQSIDLSFNADPIVPSSYTFTKNSASFSSSLTVTKSVFFPGITSASKPYVVVIDSASGQLFYLDSSSLGGGTATFSGTNTQVVFFSGSTQISGSPSMSYDYTNSHFRVTGSTTLSGSTFVSGLNNTTQTNVVTINPTTGQLFYTSSNSLTGVSIPLDIKDDGNPVYSNPTVLNFTGSGVSASANGTTVDIYIPGGGVGTPGGDNTQIQFNSGSEFSGSGNFTFNYGTNIVGLTGSIIISGSTTLTGSMFVSGAISSSFGPNTIGFYGTASWAQSASQAISSSYSLSSSYALSASYSLSSSYALSASYSNTSSFSFTSSLAYTASFITASNVWGPFGSSSVQSASYASGSTSASYAGTASYALVSDPYPINIIGSTLYSLGLAASGIPSSNNTINSIFFGTGSGFNATNASQSNFLGANAGTYAASANNSNFIGNNAGAYAVNANNSTFIGNSAGSNAENANNSTFIGNIAGTNATNANNSNFIGTGAGINATNANNSNFLGQAAGGTATNASQSNFLGYQTGYGAISASTSTLIGYQVGFAPTTDLSIGPNNIIIGTNITLAPQRKNSINIGGIIFGTGSYSTTAGTPFTGSAGGKIGINVVEPTYNLHISGTVGFPNLTDSNTATKVVLLDSNGQLFTTASNAIGGGGSGTPTPPGGTNTQIQFNSGSTFSGSGNFTFDYVNNITYLTGSSITTGSATLTGSMFVSGAISASFGPNTVGFFGTASWAQSASQAVSSSYALTASFATTSSAAPSDTYIQYNKDGLLGAEQYFRYIYDSHSLQHGFNTTALGDYSHTEGSSSLASGDWSHAEGKNTTASGQYSHAEGSNTKAEGAGSHAEGLLAIAAGSFSHAEGRFTTASGDYSHAEGISSEAYGLHSHAEGSGTTAYGTASHAEGRFTTALGDYSHAEGYQTYTSKSYSHAEGYETSASGQASHAEGNNTIALGSYQAVVGQFNIANTSQSAFIVGDGVDGSNRHNLLFASKSHFEVSASNVFLQGLPTLPEANILVYNTSSGQVYYTASSAIGGGGSGTPTPPGGTNTQIQFNSGSTFSGSANLKFDYTANTLTLTGSMFVSGAISASFGPNTVGFYGTASWAQSASQAVSSSYALTASFATFASAAYAAPSNTYVQFNSGGLFSGSQHFTYNYPSQSLQQGYDVISSGLYQTVIGRTNLTSTSQSAFIIGDGGEGIELSVGNIYLATLPAGAGASIFINTASSGVVFPDDYFTGGTLTFVSESIAETFTTEDVTYNNSDRYEFDIAGVTTKNYISSQTTVIVTGGPAAKHNLLFASRSWFELDAKDSYIKNLPPLPSPYIIGYNISSGQLSYTTVFPYTGSAIISGSLVVTGSVTSTLGFTGSLQGTAATASYVANALVTASVSTNVITFTKGDGSTFPITVNTGSTNTLIAAKYMGEGAVLTGSTAISASYNLLIPANTLTVGDTVRINCLWDKPNAATSTQFYFYITGSTTEFSRSVTGATQIARFGTAANRGIPMSRLLYIASATSTQTVNTTLTVLPSDEHGLIGNATWGGTSSINIDWTQNQYIIFAASNATAADRTNSYRFMATKV